jgi:hypothetical protein
MSLGRLFNSLLNMATLADMKPAEQNAAEQHGVILRGVLLYPARTIFSTSDGVSISLARPEYACWPSHWQRVVKALALRQRKVLFILGPHGLWVILYRQK